MAEMGPEEELVSWCSQGLYPSSSRVVLHLHPQINPLLTPGPLIPSHPRIQLQAASDK